MESKLTLTEEDKFGLLPLWEAIFSIYEEFAKICKRHNLRHYALGGTLLGAVRHNGFIPWDDDFDVAMPRSDYDKFIECAKTELPEHLKFLNWENTPEFPLMFGKVQDTRKDFVLSMEKRLGHMLSNGIYIDIFPLDGYTEKNKFWIKLRDAFLLPVERFHMYRYHELSKRGRKAWLMGAVMSMLVPWMRKQHQFFRIHERTLRRAKFDVSEYVADCSQSFNLFRFPYQKRNSWGKPTPHVFNGRTVMIPEYPEEPLSARFGTTYMTLPSAEKRHPTHGYAYRCAWWLGPTR